MTTGVDHPIAQSALDAFQKGDFPAALRDIEAWHQAEPTNTTCLNLMGVVQKELNRPDDALASYDKAIAVDPSDMYSYSHKGRLLSGMGRHEEAIAPLLHYLEQHPDSADDLDAVGGAKLALGRKEEALSFFDRAIAANPLHAPFHSNRSAVLYQMREFQSAYDSIVIALQRDPNFVNGLQNASVMAAELDKAEEARQHFRRFTQLSRDQNAVASVKATLRKLGVDTD